MYPGQPTQPLFPSHSGVIAITYGYRLFFYLTSGVTIITISGHICTSHFTLLLMFGQLKVHIGHIPRKLTGYCNKGRGTQLDSSVKCDPPP